MLNLFFKEKHGYWTRQKCFGVSAIKELTNKWTEISNSKRISNRSVFAVILKFLSSHVVPSPSETEWYSPSTSCSPNTSRRMLPHHLILLLGPPCFVFHIVPETNKQKNGYSLFPKELWKDTCIAIQILNVIRITCPFAVSMKIELNLYSHSGSTPVSGTIDLSGLIVSIINSSTICFKEASESSFVSRYFLKLCPKRSACKVGNEFYKYVQELFAFELLEEV